MKHLETFKGKCDVTKMLKNVGNLDELVFKGNTILLEVSEENIKNKLCICRRK